MSRVKIRVKMMLWYTLLTTILLAVFLPILYSVLSRSLLSNEKNNIETAMSQAMISVEFENNVLSIQDDITLSSSMPTIIWDKSGKVLYANTKIEWSHELPYAQGDIRRIELNDVDWLVYDKTVLNDGKEQARIRICSSLEGMENTLHRTLFIILAILPLYFIITILGGLIIAKRSLRPISMITDLAKSIKLSDLSKRITGVICDDEVGELADTFNGMLASLEESFDKEKRFASDASHELRMPVSVIMANAEAVLAARQDEETEKSISVILLESKRMNAIISQLLMLTKGIEGKYKPNFEQNSLNIIINAVLEQLQDEAERQSVTLIDETDSEIFALIDQSLITQMMLNIISNAIKYGKPGGHVWVEVVCIGNEYLLTIKDDGIGIAANELPFIFDRFFRVDKSRDRSGSGLGLSIVKWIVDTHKGSIDVKSEIDSGTIFSILLNGYEEKKNK